MYRVVHGPVPNGYDVNRYGPPLIFLEDEYGGQSVIIKDDACYVLMNKDRYGVFNKVFHWYSEAALSLRDYLNELEIDSMVD